MGSLHAVIMAGGSGTRFWPASRQSRPKQLLPLCAGEPMIRAAVARVSGRCSPSHTWIVTNEAQRAATLALLPGFPEEQVILEPEARDTAPCVALAVATISARDPDATIVVLPADQAIEPVSEVARMLDADEQGNHRSLHGEADAQFVESDGNIVYAEGRRTVALFGVEGLVVAAVGDAVLVCPKDRAGELKKVIEQLRARGREDLL